MALFGRANRGGGCTASVFFFGDDSREKGVDLAPFREILATFRTKPMP